MNYPPLTIQLQTCDRWEYARKTIKSTLRHLRYSGEVAIHVADDSREVLPTKEICRRLDVPWVDHHALVQGCAYQTRRMANNP